MSVFVFQSAKDTDVFGFTGQETGGNLPLELSPWVARGEALPSGADDEVARSVRIEGYFLARAGIKISQ